MNNETMAEALQRIKEILQYFDDGIYTEQEAGDAIYLAWAGCKERQELAEKS